MKTEEKESTEVLYEALIKAVTTKNHEEMAYLAAVVAGFLLEKYMEGKQS